MKIGDKVLEGDKIGIIIKEYNGAFDWEVAFINKSCTGCIVDCCYEDHLELYNWKPYPTTFSQIFKLFWQLSKCVSKIISKWILLHTLFREANRMKCEHDWNLWIDQKGDGKLIEPAEYYKVCSKCDERRRVEE